MTLHTVQCQSTMKSIKSVRQKVEGRDGPLCWYRVGDNVAVYPFTRSRMNRKTLGCYGKSARTSPVVSTWMWGVCYLNMDGMPSAWDATLKSFRAPSPPPESFNSFDLKADALAKARAIVTRMAQDIEAFTSAFQNRSPTAKRICDRFQGEKAEAIPLWQIIDEEVGPLIREISELRKENIRLIADLGSTASIR